MKTNFSNTVTCLRMVTQCLCDIKQRRHDATVALLQSANFIPCPTSRWSHCGRRCGINSSNKAIHRNRTSRCLGGLLTSRWRSRRSALFVTVAGPVRRVACVETIGRRRTIGASSSLCPASLSAALVVYSSVCPDGPYSLQVSSLSRQTSRHAPRPLSHRPTTHEHLVPDVTALASPHSHHPPRHRPTVAS